MDQANKLRDLMKLRAELEGNDPVQKPDTTDRLSQVPLHAVPQPKVQPQAQDQAVSPIPVQAQVLPSEMQETQIDQLSPTVAKPKTSSSKVITITSGKGGVGKSNFTVNLAIQLAIQKKSVVIIDADFGLANVEVLLGIVPKCTLSDFIFGEKSLDEILTDAPMGIKLISGGSGLVELRNLSDEQLNVMFNSLSYIDSFADYILIDTGAGISDAILSFIQVSDKTIIVTTPEPTSVADAYTVIKSVQSEGLESNLYLVVNRAEDQAEGLEIYKKISIVSKRFLNLEINSYGSIPFDTSIIKAVKQQKPFSILFPNSEAAKAILNISRHLIRQDFESEYKAELDSKKGLVGILSPLKANQPDAASQKKNKTDDGKDHSVPGFVSFVKRLTKLINR